MQIALRESRHHGRKNRDTITQTHTHVHERDDRACHCIGGVTAPFQPLKGNIECLHDIGPCQKPLSNGERDAIACVRRGVSGALLKQALQVCTGESANHTLTEYKRKQGLYHWSRSGNRRRRMH